MSEDTANQIEEYYDRLVSKTKRSGFIERMEHKLHAKERQSYQR